MKALRDKETQTKGFVYVVYTVGQKKFVSGRPEKIPGIWSRVPARLAALHFCYDHLLLKEMVDQLCKVMEGHQLCRFRSHFGRSSFRGSTILI